MSEPRNAGRTGIGRFKVIAMVDVERTIPQLGTLRKRNLEADVVSMLAKRFNLGATEALDLYYSSELAGQVAKGSYGIQYLDASYLVEDLLENEPRLFEDIG